MWEPNTGSRRPQCSECKSTSKRPADNVEIAAYQRGERRSPLVDGSADSTDGSTDDGAERVESDPDPELNADDIQVEKVDIEALLGDKHRERTPPARRTGAVLIGTVVALVAVGSLVGWFLVSRRDRQRTQRGRENVENVADERRRYVMPRATGW